MNIGKKSYTTHCGVDFENLPDGSPYPRVSALLNLWKKYRLFNAQGITSTVDPADCWIMASRELFPTLKITPWTEIMMREITYNKELIFLGPASCGKSHVLALAAISWFVTDPASTACVLCSSTKEDLKARAWSPLKEMTATLSTHPAFSGSPIRALETEYMICNTPDPRIPETMTKRASIRGVSMDNGRLQGQHVSGAHSMTALIVDELSTLDNVEALMTGIVNLSTGTDFRFCAAANPDGWNTDISARFYMPPGGPQSVNPDTGSWTSRSGYKIVHFNGERSPAILDPSKEKEWPFLLNKATLDRHLERCNGDRNAADYLKMCVGFPASGTTGDAVVLDPVVAAREQVSQSLAAPVWGSRTLIGKVAGVDPAWSSGGDAAIMASPNVFSQEGKAFIDFTNVVRILPIVSSDTKPVLMQLREGVIARIKADGGPAVNHMAIDSSGNQALADDVSSFLGPGCLAVNSSNIASDSFLRAGETQDSLKARARIADRGTESWVVLAEFCRAGMVRGLPLSVVNDLCNRRFLRKADGSDLSKRRLESKDNFCKRVGHGSPNEADACALAALAVKERLGVMPFGSVPTPNPQGIIPGAYTTQQVSTYTPFDKGESDNNNFDDIGAFED